MTRKAFLSALLATTALTLTGFPAQAQGACLSQIEIQSLSDSGQIMPFPEVRALLSGKALSFDVCEEGGRLVYKINVDEGGQARIISLDARTGRP
ncbi:MAG: PepSY domain-containing protein [Alphaproteobacteria bacterium]|nr:PepSY domain-containing protein [Alphaproteobacteria bacterium]